MVRLVKLGEASLINIERYVFTLDVLDSIPELVYITLADSYSNDTYHMNNVCKVFLTFFRKGHDLSLLSSFKYLTFC